MARRLFEIFILVALIPINHLTFGRLAGNLIWSRERQSFIPIESIPAFRAERNNYLRESRQLETYNFQKESLKVGYYKDQNLIHFYNNDTKITGVTGEMWNMLSEYLNFTMVTIRVDQRSIGDKELVEMVTRNEIDIIPKMSYFAVEMQKVDFTMPIWKNSYRLYIKPESNIDDIWIFRVFTRRVWFFILLVFVIMSVLGYTMQRMLFRVSEQNVNAYCTMHDHLFYTFATFCCQGFIPDSFYSRIKIISFSKAIFAWLLLITFSTYVISYMTNEKILPPFEDIGTMFNSTDYNVIVFNKSLSAYKFKGEVKKLGLKNHYENRISYVNSLPSIYDLGCSGKKKYALLESEDRYRAYGRLQCGDFIPAGKSYFATWITAGVPKTFKYRRTLDMGILKLSEFGLVAGLKKRWMGIEGATVESNIEKFVNLRQVSVLYVILCLGMIASIIVFVLENIFYVYHENQRKIQRQKFVYFRGKRII